jgi:hypothetical protein
VAVVNEITAFLERKVSLGSPFPTMKPSLSNHCEAAFGRSSSLTTYYNARRRLPPNESMAAVASMLVLHNELNYTTAVRAGLNVFPTDNRSEYSSKQVVTSVLE